MESSGGGAGGAGGAGRAGEAEAPAAAAAAPPRAGEAPPTPLQQWLDGRSVLVTGGTGFVGKCVVEQLVRKAPRLRAVYVLVRPKRGRTAAARVEEEIVGSRVWDRLRGELGREAAEAAVRRKVVAVGGDMQTDGLALAPADAALLRRHVSVVIHAAASVSFDDRLDAAINTNTLGSLRVFELGRSLPLLQSYVHVSTAYVHSNRRSGSRIKERIPTLDFDPDEVVADMLAKPWSPARAERRQLDLIGTFPNTYTLTKAMTEVLLERRRGNTPLCIVRPSIVGCAWLEPVPGWVDVVSAAGAVFLSAGMGILSILPGNPRNTACLIPVDFTVAHIIAAAYVNRGRDRLSVSHSGTSDSANRCSWRVCNTEVPRWFNEHPPSQQLGKAKFSMISSHQLFQINWFARYALPSSVFSTVANSVGSDEQRKNAERLWKVVWRARLVVESFKHFTCNEWFFVSKERDRIRRALAPSDRQLWPLDVSVIDWTRWLRLYGYGMTRWVLNEELNDIHPESLQHTEMSLSGDRLLHWDSDHHKISFPGLLSDVSWALYANRPEGYTSGGDEAGVFGRLLAATGWKHGEHEAAYVPRPPFPKPEGLRAVVLSDPQVLAAVRAEVEAGRAHDDVMRQCRDVLQRMEARQDDSGPRALAFVVRKVLRQIYAGIKVDEAGLKRVRSVIAEGAGPVLLLPTHRSYMDFIVLSYVFFAYNLPLPFIAAGEDFLNMGFVSDLLRRSGAFFIRRSMREEPLYGALLTSYMQALLLRGHAVEFFQEGTRSRSGKTLPPRLGLLSAAVEPVLDGRLKEMHAIPVAVDFERPLETALYSDEVLGQSKARESLVNLLKASSVLRSDFGYISLRFGEPIALSRALPALAQQAAARSAADGKEPEAGETVGHPTDTHRAASFASSAPRAGFDPLRVPRDRTAVCRALAYRVVGEQHRVACAMPTHLAATLLLMYRHGIRVAELTSKLHWLRDELAARGHEVQCVEGEYPAAVTQRALRLLGELVRTHEGRQVVEPNSADRADYWRMIALGYYRNKLLYAFAGEALWACALYACSHRAGADATADPSPPEEGMEAAAGAATRAVGVGVGLRELRPAAGFLDRLLARELVRNQPLGAQADLEEALQTAVRHGVLEPAEARRPSAAAVGAAGAGGAGGAAAGGDFDAAAGGGGVAPAPAASPTLTAVSVPVAGEETFSMLCGLIWPLVDSYWVAVVSLFALPRPPSGDAEPAFVPAAALRARMQWLAETMYHDRMLAHYEACSLETLGNALKLLVDWRVLQRRDIPDPTAAAPGGGGKRKPRHVEGVALLPPYTGRAALRELAASVGRFRRPAAVRAPVDSLSATLAADLPMLARL